VALETRPCERCGTLATRYRKPGEVWAFWTCSRSCAAYLRHARGALSARWDRNRFRGLRESRTCARCGASTRERYVTEANYDQPWYCSRACGRPTSETAHVRTGDERPCATCGTLVYSTPGRRRQRVTIYCSKACTVVAKRAPRIERACATCGRQMALLPAHRDKKYCSRTCSTQARFKNTLPRLHNGKPARYDGLGYVLVWQPDHPNAKPSGWVLEHRLVMSNAKGRALESYEEVDHINGVRDQNGLDNLQLLSRAAHRSKTGDDRRKAKERLNERLAAAEAQVMALRAQLAALNGAADESPPD
jgi:hypothetical protein